MSIFPSVYSTLDSNALLKLITEVYSLSQKSSICFIKRGFNDTYLIKDENKKLIVRVYKHNWKSLSEIETEVALLNYLKENNISVSYPVTDNNNNYIQTINAPEGVRYIVLFSFAEGQCVRKLNLQQAHLLGVETAKIHRLTTNKFFGETVFKYSFESQFDNVIPIVKPLLINHSKQYDDLISLREEFLNVWSTINENEIKTGICHGDLQAENFHITSENKFTFFDFDFSGNGCLIYDIGVFMWYDHKNKSKEILKSFLDGYKSQQQLTPSEIALLPYFGTLRAVFQMGLYCKISDGNLLPIWPENQVAAFIDKINMWHDEQKKAIKFL